ncbi:NAD(P)H-hydrate dehydratase [Desulfobacterales bacterium HSG17]|nr:NAD(P)H-hydrate dehydratase [Desulfobacterales bacterium HSG17]
MKLVTAAQMQAIDHETIHEFGVPGIVLMENAARGAVRFFLELFPNAAFQRIGIMAGRGNNGGDGFVMARYLAQKGFQVTIFLLADTQKVSGDAALNLNLLPKLAVPVLELKDDTAFSQHHSQLVHQHIWIDAVFGTGLNSNVRGHYKTALEFLNQSGHPIFSVDIPSGLSADTGKPSGTAVKATATATFAFAKPGHILLPGALYTGKLKIIDIGIPPHIADTQNTNLRVITPGRLKKEWRPRNLDDHKGRFGHILVVAGSPGKTGAAAMTAMAAMRAGAGLVTLAVPKSIHSQAEILAVEPMTTPLPEEPGGVLGLSATNAIDKLLIGKTVLVIGPGLGTHPETRKLVGELVANATIPVVVDADGLNGLTHQLDCLARCKSQIILTPHPGEMARLVNQETAAIQNDRINIALQFAVHHKVHLVLKGANTLIASPNGIMDINPTGNPGMASGGMGDVLTGLIAGFLAQGYTPPSACRFGVYLHGTAADQLAVIKGPQGFLASDVSTMIPETINSLVNHPPSGNWQAIF